MNLYNFGKYYYFNFDLVNFEINDHIEFINITTLEIMFVKITNLYHFKNFEVELGILLPLLHNIV